MAFIEMQKVTLLLWMATLPFSFGCNQTNHPLLAPVKGTVTVEGTPLAQGTIIFEGSGVRQAIGQIVEGQITHVTTYAPGDGVPVGSQRVVIQATEIPKSRKPEGDNPGNTPATSLSLRPGEPLIPVRYFNPATSGLTCEIKPDRNELTFELRSE
jgi:hypothetical protein